MHHAIFVSYRREDAPDAAGRVYDRLADAFGEASVFKDVDTLPVGEDFGAYIAGVIARCSVTLVLIGPSWVSAENHLGRRLEDHSDWVRVEVETALTTPSTKVIPVLVSGASMPSAGQLPESLHPLLCLNAANVRRDPDFHQDMGKLIAALSTLGVIRADGPSAATVWSAVRQTENIEDHCHVIDTFPGTVEAFEARQRVDQLRMVKALRKLGGYLSYVEDIIEPKPDDAPAWLLVEGVDIFRQRWTGTWWDNEILDLRKVGGRFVECLQWYDDQRHWDERSGIDAETPTQWLNRVDEFFAKLAAGAG
jgi:hypothetical protein